VKTWRKKRFFEDFRGVLEMRDAGHAVVAAVISRALKLRG
jgi:hypothetical protein